MTIVAIIPARGGSKRLPRKNIKPLGGKPLIAYTIEHALNSKYLDRVIVSTDDDEIAERARIIRDYGQKERFHYVDLGFNYHMTEMQAAIGLIQLRKLEQFVENKRRNAKLLTKLLDEVDGIIPPTELPNCKHCYMLYSIRVVKGSRDKLSKLLEQHGIQNRVYFPPVHKSPMMSKFEYRCDSLKMTENVSSTILSLPSHPALSKDDIYHIYECVKRCMEEIS